MLFEKVNHLIKELGLKALLDILVNVNLNPPRSSTALPHHAALIGPLLRTPATDLDLAKGHTPPGGSYSSS